MRAKHGKSWSESEWRRWESSLTNFGAGCQHVQSPSYQARLDRPLRRVFEFLLWTRFAVLAAPCSPDLWGARGHQEKMVREGCPPKMPGEFPEGSGRVRRPSKSCRMGSGRVMGFWQTPQDHNTAACVRSAVFQTSRTRPELVRQLFGGPPSSPITHVEVSGQRSGERPFGRCSPAVLAQVSLIWAL